MVHLIIKLKNGRFSPSEYDNSGFLAGESGFTDKT